MLSLVNLYILVFHCKIPLYDNFLPLWVSTHVEISLLWIKIEFNSWLLKSNGTTFNRKNVWKCFYYPFCFCFQLATTAESDSENYLIFDIVPENCVGSLNSNGDPWDETQLIIWANNCHTNVMYLNIFLQFLCPF